MINGNKFRGQVNPDNVFEAVCAGFNDMPPGCRMWLYKEGISVPGGVSTATMFMIIGVIVVCNFMIVLVYRNQL